MNTLKDCYFSPTQWKLMQLLGCKINVKLNGKQVSQIFDHGSKHDLLFDEYFVGTALLKDIEYIEEE